MGQPTPSQSLPQPFGRYVLQDLLGEGGFARVYRAELKGPAGFKKTVAIKLMRDLLPGGPDGIIHEGRVGGLLKHRNVVDTYELGVAEGQSFVAMEWVDGLSLKEILLTSRPPPSVVLEIGLGICRGLSYAHGLRSTDGSLGLVHMDLKPANILVGWDGSVKVADFGIARLTGVSDAHTHSSAGTPAYLSPEQASGQPVDARSDLFSLGAVLYELATGQRLFSAEPDVLGKARVRHIEEVLAGSLDAAEKHVPGLADILRTCLTLSIEDRVLNAKAVSEPLRVLCTTVGSEPALDMWLADTLGEQERLWVADVDSWSPGSVDETLDISTPEAGTFEDALAELDASDAVTSAITALQQAEQALTGLSTKERARHDKILRKHLGRRGLEVVVDGGHPYLVLDPIKGGAWCAGVQVANYTMTSVMGRLLYNIAVHGAEWSRERLYSEVWDQTYRPPSSDAALRMAISRMRNQLKGSGVVVEHQGEGRYGLAGGPSVVCWRGKPVAIEDASIAVETPSPENPQPDMRTNLGPEPNAFIGRQHSLTELGERFNNDCRMVTILGAPGTGKTRFMRRFGAQQVEAGDSVWFCDLTEARTAIGVLGAIAAALGVPLTGKDTDEEAIAQRLGHAIAGRGRTWILLDNAEQVVDELKAQIKVWWDQACEARFLVTSRTPLRAEMEHRFPLSPLSIPKSGESKAEQADTEAVKLFVSRSRKVRAGFVLGPDNAEDISAIVRELDGLPLAIELAAARIAMWPAKTLRARLTDRFRLLSRPQATGPRRQATLRGALDWSWDLLTPWERSALAQCSVFRNGFTWEAAEAVVDTSPWPEAPWTVDVIGALVEHSLLQVHLSADGDSRLSILVSVAAYGAEKLAQSGEDAAQQCQTRHSAYYAQFGTEEALASLVAHGGIARRKQLTLELDNLIIAAKNAMAMGQGPTAALCCLATITVLESTGPFKHGVELGEAILQMDIGPVHQGRLLDQVGWLLKVSGQMSEGLEHCKKALALFRQEGARSDEAWVLGSLGIQVQDIGQMELAQEYFELSLVIYREIGNRRGEAVALNNLGSQCSKQSKINEALKYYKSAQEIFRDVGDRRGEGSVLGNVALQHFRKGQMSQAIATYTESIQILQEVGDRRSQGNVLGNLSSALHRDGQFEEALDCYHRALRMNQEVGNRRIEGMVLGNIGILYEERGQFEKALNYYNLALQIHREVHNLRSQGIIVGNIGNLHTRLGRMTLAEEHLNQALELHREVKNRRHEGTVLAKLGVLYRLKEMPDVALEYFDQALPIHHEIHDKGQAGFTLANLGRLHMEKGQLNLAVDHFQQALGIHRDMKNRSGEGNMLSNLAIAMARQGDIPAARKHLAVVESMLHHNDNQRHHLAFLCRRGEIDLLDKDLSAAQIALARGEAIAEALKLEPTDRLQTKLQTLRDALAKATEA